MICYLARHGKDDDTVRGGWSQQPLTNEGKAQADELSSFVQGSDLAIKHIYSSDLLRAMQTAQPVADKLHLPVIPMPEFREVNNGDLAGMKNELANKMYPGLYWNTLDWERRYPGGESPREFYERISTAWDAFQKMILEQNENVMLVTHGGVINVILSIVNGEKYSNKTAMRTIRNAELIALEYQGKDWQEQRNSVASSTGPMRWNEMKTVSINVMNLCVPCENRCRYCLLSYNGKVTGVDYKRSEVYAKRFYEWLKENRPDLSFLFGFGYSMEHPDLLNAIDFCRSIGSATGEFLQFGGMKFRTDEELEALLRQLQAHGIKLIDLTFYGTENYHDRFAARAGDYQLMMRTLTQANKIGLDVTVSIPITHENADQMDALIVELEQHQTLRIACFVPHSEGRGRRLDPIRFSVEDYNKLSENVRNRLNINRFKTEREWLQTGLPIDERRMLAVTLTPDNIAFFEGLPFEDTIAYLEKLDDDYYNTIPTVTELAKIYGDPNGDRYYSARDLYLNYQRRYIADNGIEIYDINDERQCFSRRF